MKITIYTVKDCQFSKAEKEYLQAHNVSFEEKNLESNKEFLTEMLAVSNNFAGTPVTKVEKDDGQIAVLKGYVKDELDKVLGYSQPQETVVNSTINAPPKNPVQPAPPVPQPPQPQPTPKPEPTPPPPAVPTPQDSTTDALNSVLQNLQSKSSTQSPSTPPVVNNPPPVNPPPTGTLPNIPDPDFK